MNIPALNVPNEGFMDPQSTIGYFGLREGMRVADFGSGSGYFTILIARIVGEGGLVTAIDVMDSALDMVRAKAKSEGLKNVDTIRSNLEVTGSSGLASDSQDFVLLKNILFQSNKKEEIIKEARRVLKSGGGLAVIDWKKGSHGFGPPDDLRTDENTIREMVLQVGLDYLRFIEVDVFHYGLMFVKK